MPDHSVLKGKHLTFTGAFSDWPHWHIKMSSALRLAGYGKILEAVDKSPNDESMWGTLDQDLDRCLFDNLILLLDSENATVAYTLYSSLSTNTSPAFRGSLVWQFILGKYRRANSTPVLLLRLKEQCMSINLTSPANYLTYIASIRKLVAEMNTCVANSASAVDHVGYLVRGIPARQEYAALLTTLRNQHALDPVNAEREIAATCQTLAVLAESDHSASLFAFSHPPSSSSYQMRGQPPGRPGQSSHPPKDWTNVVCKNCGLKGHGWRKCRKPFSGKTSSPQRQSTVNELPLAPPGINAIQPPALLPIPSSVPFSYRPGDYIDQLASVLSSKIQMNVSDKYDSSPIYTQTPHDVIFQDALLDTGSCAAVCPDLYRFRTISPSTRTFRSASKSAGLIHSKGVGTLVLPVLDSSGNTRELEIPNCQFCPDVHQIILRPKALAALGYHVDPIHTMTLTCTHHLDPFTIPIFEKDELPVLRLAPSSSISSISHRSPNVTHLRFLHAAYGHVNIKRLAKLFNIPVPTAFQCSVCLKGKIKRKKFLKKKPRLTSCRGELIHTDICGPIAPLGPKNEKYMIYFIDDFTQQGFLYLMQTKSEAPEMLRKFITDFGALPGCLHTIRADNAQEYKAGEFARLCATMHLRQVFSAPYTAQQNGRVERRWQTLNNMARCMLLESDLPKELWVYACLHANYILNTIYLKTSSTTSTKPSDNPLIWGQRAVVKELNPTHRTSKFDAKGLEARFIGYSSQQSARLYYIPSTKCVITSRDDVIIRHDIATPTHTPPKPKHKQTHSSHDTYELNPLIFDAIERIVGTHDWDLFASHAAHKSPNYFTRLDNALSKLWTGLGHLWINPPWHLFEQVIDKLLKEANTPFSLLMPHTKSPSIDHLVRWSLTRPLLIPHTAYTFTNKDTHILPNSPPWKYTLLWNCDPLQTACSPNVLHEIQYLFHALDNNIPIRAIDIPTPPSTSSSPSDTTPTTNLSPPPTLSSAPDTDSDTDPPTELADESTDADIVLDEFFHDNADFVGFLCALRQSFLDQYVPPSLDYSPIEPRTYKQAMNSPEAPFWMKAIIEELTTLIDMGTYSVQERPPDVNILDTKDVFKIKKNAFGKIARFKNRCVAKGFKQIFGKDYTECHSNVIRKESVRHLCALTAASKSRLYQLDIKNAYPCSELKENIYIKIPPGIELLDPSHPIRLAIARCKDPVFKLNKSLYGLKQAGRNWEEHMAKIITEMGYTASLSDPCLYEIPNNSPLRSSLPQAIGVYVDDLGISAKHEQLYENFCKKLAAKNLTVTALGLAKLLLGVRIIQNPDFSIFLTQDHFIEEILQEFKLQDTHITHTPIHDNIHDPDIINSEESNTSEDIDWYRSLFGKLLYISEWTRPDITFAVNYCASKQDNPSVTDGKRLIRIAAYLKGTIHHAIAFYPNSPTNIIQYVDSDYAGDPVDRKSTMGYITLTNGPLSWRSTKQKEVALSTSNAEYVAISEGAREVKFLSYLTRQPLNHNIPTILCDNKGAILNCKQELPHKRSKHIDVKYHFIKDEVKQNNIEVRHVRSKDNIADIFTKPLRKVLFRKFRDLILVDTKTDIDLKGAC